MSSVRIAGTYWLDQYATTRDLMDSTIWRTRTSDTDTSLGWSGDYLASVTFTAPRAFSPPWFKVGKSFEVIEDGVRTWGGVLAEPQWSGEAWTLTAYGYGMQAAEYQALTSVGVPTTIPNTAFDAAITRGMPLTRTDNLSTTSFGTTATSAAVDAGTTVSTLLDRAAITNGQRWWVDSAGRVSLRSDPTAVTWMLTPGSAVMGVTDENFVTKLYAYYVSAVSGGVPTAYDVKSATDSEAATQFGVREAMVDLTALGLLSGANAQANVDGRFALVGGRMGYVNDIDITASNLWRPGLGAASPMSMCGEFGAGTMLQVPGITDMRATATFYGSALIPLGEVQRYHDDQRVVAKPLGFVSRDFNGALAAAQAAVVGEDVAA